MKLTTSLKITTTLALMAIACVFTAEASHRYYAAQVRQASAAAFYYQQQADELADIKAVQAVLPAKVVAEMPMPWRM